MDIFVEKFHNKSLQYGSYTHLFCRYLNGKLRADKFVLSLLRIYFTNGYMFFTLGLPFRHLATRVIRKLAMEKIESHRYDNRVEHLCKYFRYYLRYSFGEGIIETSLALRIIEYFGEADKYVTTNNLKRFGKNMIRILLTAPGLFVFVTCESVRGRYVTCCHKIRYALSPVRLDLSAIDAFADVLRFYVDFGTCQQYHNLMNTLDIPMADGRNLLKTILGRYPVLAHHIRQSEQFRSLISESM